MRTGTLGRRYAKALIEIAGEQGKLEQIGRELTEFAKTYEGSKELREIFENPGVSSQARKKIVQALAARMSLSPTVGNTLMMLSDRGRMRFIGDVVAAFQMMAESAAGRVRAEVVTATQMPQAYFDELQKVLEQVTGKRVVVVARHDPSLIAGVVARVGDRVFDGSVQNRLNELKDELLSR